MRTRFRLPALALVLWTASHAASLAEGAVALGLPANVATDGVAIGHSDSHDTREGAERSAMALCQREEQGATKGLCRIVLNFKDQCVAVAVDPLSGTAGFGWAVADTRQAAAERALALCRDSSMPERRNACKIDGGGCDGSAK